MAGGRRERLPGTLLREYRGRWEAGKATWNDFAGIPWQVGGGKGYLERFCGKTVAGGRRERLPGTLSRRFRGRWAAGRDTWNTFAGKPWQVEGREMPPATLSREFRGRWEAGKNTWNAFAGKPWQVGGEKRHLEHFRGDSVPGGRRRRTPGTLSREFRGRWEAGKDTWNAFTGIPWQVDGGEMPPGTLSQGFRGRWEAGRDTWNAFAGIPCQVDGRKGHLERFCRISVPGGKRDETPGTLSQDFRARWEAGKDTWNTFAGKPCQVGSREMLPDTLSRENRDRWAAGKATWNAFAGIPWQVGGRKGHLTRFCRKTVPGRRQEVLPDTATATAGVR